MILLVDEDRDLMKDYIWELKKEFGEKEVRYFTNLSAIISELATMKKEKTLYQIECIVIDGMPGEAPSMLKTFADKLNDELFTGIAFREYLKSVLEYQTIKTLFFSIIDKEELENAGAIIIDESEYLGKAGDDPSPMQLVAKIKNNIQQ